MGNSPVIDAAVGSIDAGSVAFKMGKGATISVAIGAESDSGAVTKIVVRKVALIAVVRSPTGRMDIMISLSGAGVVDGIRETTTSVGVAEGPGGMMISIADEAGLVASADVGVTVMVTAVGSLSSSLGLRDE